jgi:hypothetical protein
MSSILTPGKSYYYDNTLKWLSSKYGEEVGRFLANRISKMIRQTNDFCMNNFRVAEEGTPEMKRYKEAKENGCCGFNDQKFVFKVWNEEKLSYIKKRIFWIGYNFGH